VQRRLTKLAGAALLIFVAALLSACDLQEDADLDNGRELFTAQCGTCHILAEAGTTSDVGPDLDAAFAASRATGGFDEDTIEGVIESQIANPRETDPEDPTYMPADLVTGEDAEDVAAYVASVAGVPGIGPPTVPGGPGAQVFANNGCGACHVLSALGGEAVGQVGPNLDEVLPGQSPKMIESSIVDPDADVASGFSAGVMPTNYGEQIPPEDLKLLVKFLAESAGGNGGGNGGG